MEREEEEEKLINILNKYSLEEGRKDGASVLHHLSAETAAVKQKYSTVRLVD